MQQPSVSPSTSSRAWNRLASIRGPLLFLIVFAAIALYYSYPQYYHYLPCSVHSWRQTDGTAIALTYYLQNTGLFEPQFLNQMQGDPHTVGEFPLLYYVAAQLFKYFGWQDGLFRLLNLLLFASGCYALYWVGKQWIKDELLVLCIPVLLFSSPVMAYYSFNFLPDPPALGLALLAWPAYLRFQQKAQYRWLYLSMLLLLLAGLIKVTALLSYGILIGISGLQWLRLLPSSSPRLLHLPRLLVAFLLVPLGFAAWYFWAKHYNASHQSTYFLASIQPIWSMSPEHIERTLRRIWKGWLDDYFFPPTHLLLLGCTLFTGWHRRHLPSGVAAVIGLSLMGTLGIFLLWFNQFLHHDYYIITLMLSAVALLMGSAIVLVRRFPGLVRHWAFRSLLLIFVLLNLHHAKKELHYRYADDSKYMKSYKSIYAEQEALQQFLLDRGVEPEALVISTPDESPNTTLYYLRRSGWTQFNNVKKWTKVQQGKHFDWPAIQDLRQQGARYLILHDPAYLQREELQPALQKPLGDFKGQLFVFDLEGL
ncbi:MAG: hypothetical protein AAGG75_26710 [Bacteroidota bacterium]